MIDATDQLSIANRLACEKLIGKSRSTPGDNAYLHSIRIARYIREDLKLTDLTLQIAALFHDIVEDSDVTVDLIRDMFGDEVASIVSRLTRGSYTSNDQYDKMINKIEQNLTLKNAPYGVRVIKCADRIDNLRHARTIPEGDKRYFKIPYWVIETRTSMLPIARNTHDKLYKDMREVLHNLERDFSGQIKNLLNKYLVRGDISSNIREHLEKHMGSASI